MSTNNDSTTVRYLQEACKGYRAIIAQQDRQIAALRAQPVKKENAGMKNAEVEYFETGNGFKHAKITAYQQNGIQNNQYQVTIYPIVDTFMDHASYSHMQILGLGLGGALEDMKFTAALLNKAIQIAEQLHTENIEIAKR